MPKKPKSKLPRLLQEPLAAAIRAAVSVPLVGGLALAGDAAERLGRWFGSLRLNRKRLARAQANLAEAFPHLDEEARRELALGAYGHLLRLGTELMFTPRLINHDGWTRHLALGDISRAVEPLVNGRPCIMITGHVGNWELVGSAIGLLGFPLHAVYRPLDLEPLDRWVRASRAKLGVTLVNKFGAVHDLPKALSKGHPVGLVADQNGGDRGVFVPFFGRLVSTYKSIGLLALQFDATLVCGYARRARPGEQPRGRTSGGARPGMNYVMEVVDTFGPGDWKGHPDPLFYLTARYRRAIETMVLRSPEQYLWMHRIWRSRPLHERQGKPFPPLLRERLESLPWMTAGDIDRVVARSERDTAEYATSEDRRRSSD